MNNLFSTPPERKSFLGTGWAFPVHFDKSAGSVVVVTEEEDIWQSLIILFSTSTLERVLQPQYGCNLRDFVFAKMDVSTISLLEELIKRSIALYEPRIKLEQLTITLDDLEGVLNITVTYVVRTTNTRFNRVYPFYYLEGTNVEL